jgi:hypothetical protein
MDYRSSSDGKVHEAMMRAWLVAFVLVVGCTKAEAASISLICTGDLNASGKTIPVAGETAILDLDSGTFKPPLYNSFPLLKVRDTQVTFGSESQTLSVWGSLDRVSGSLSMSVMEPGERRKVQAGGSAHFMAWITAKCVPAQRMF